MTENGSPVDADSADQTAEQFPLRLRVHALARTLGLTSREVLAHLEGLGIEARSASSSVSREEAQSVADRAGIDVTAGDDAAGADAAPETPAAAAAGDSLFSAVTVEDPTVPAAAVDATAPLFMPPSAAEAVPVEPAVTGDADETDGDSTDEAGDDTASDDDQGAARPRRRRRGRRGRGRGRGEGAEDNENDENGSADETAAESGSDTEAADTDGEKPAGSRPRKTAAKKTAKKTDDAGTADGGESSEAESSDSADDDGDETGGDDNTTPSSKRRRRRRRRKGGGDADDASPDDPPNTVVHEREPRAKRARDEVQGISGSTRLEAKRQRRRDGRDAGRRRPPILSESEFLARREAVERVMVVREHQVDPAQKAADPHAPTEDYTQVAVLEDGVLVEHFVTTETSQSMVGNIYLGRVQNVLPGMEAAFVDIGRGRNGVLYAGEVNWEAAGLDGGSRKIEQALKPGDNVLVQVSKDPVGHKGARLTTQISLAGRYLVYVPGGTSTGISRKLPDTERKRLKQILAKVVPDDAGVIIRTASEGVSEEDLGADVARLEAQWKAIEAAAEEHTSKGSGTTRALYEEPDLLVRVVRDLFNEDFTKLVVEGDKAWDLVSGYVGNVAPDLAERVTRYEKDGPNGPDSFATYRVDEQLAKALDRKVWLPSGGTLIIEHTEAMTVVDVNTGKFTGSGGNLEETVTRNNLEAAEEIVRQMRLRDIGGMIIVDFIDMVLESNRDLVLRRLTEALSRDRTRHQVSEVTSLGLVQMTRKRLGTGLLEAFSTTCTACQGRGLIVHQTPVEVRSGDGGETGGKRKRGKRKSDKPEQPAVESIPPHKPAAEHPLFKAMAHHEDGEHPDGHGPQESAETVTDDAAPAAAEQSDDAPATGRRRRRGGRGRGARNTEAAETTEVVEPAEASEDAEAAETTEAAETAVTTEAPEAEVVEVEAVEVETAPEPEVAVVTTRRRRTARRASAPSAPAEPIEITVDRTPVTTVAEQASEPVVEVKRSPRRRATRRAPGAPSAE
ncbi:MAG: Rne/Rng family ribonuclease [Gordonia sp. (in: high G+C Gram-positive bacteria)]|uniref:Rne/Rng family ribonuclease n=1 Tax=Gordonia sp. (in: high G+C Gram-positive bacteria) TaxID=84139 RepID=UPI0039E55924